MITAGGTEHIKHLEKIIEELDCKVKEIEKENKELKEMNRKLMLMAFPEATEHLMKMVSNIAKTIKESGLDE